MSNPRDDQILLRVGGQTWAKYGVPWRRLGFDPREREKPTHTRADATTCATYIDPRGLVLKAAANVPRLEYVDLDGDGVRETPGILLEGSRANVVLQSQNFGATWTTPVGAPTRSAAETTLGSLALDLIGDDNAGATEYYAQSPTLTGDGTKSYSWFAKKGTSAESNVTLWDETIGAVRGRVIYSFDANGVLIAPTVPTGTLLRTQLIGSGVYRFEAQAPSVVAANDNQIWIVPATSGGVTATGDLRIGGVQVENAVFPSSYIPTTTGAVTRAADSFTLPFGFGPQDLTVLARVARPAWADASGALGVSPGVMDLGNNVGGTLRLYAIAPTRHWTSDITTSGSSVNSAMLAGALQTICAQYKDLTTGAKTQNDVGAGFTGFVGGAATAFSTFGSQTLRVGGVVGSPNELSGVLVDLIIARGLFTLAEMQAVS